MSLEIPKNFPLGNLISQELTQICIGLGEVSLNFHTPSSIPGRWELGACITLESGFELSKKGKSICVGVSGSIGASAGGLTSLLGQTIVSVERLPKSELSLSFSNNLNLRLSVNAEGFESYHLSISGDVVDI